MGSIFSQVIGRQFPLKPLSRCAGTLLAGNIRA
jgi:hypothetical protein